MLLTRNQIKGNLKRTAEKGLISLLNQYQLEQLALKYFGVYQDEQLIGYQCPYSGKVYTNYEDIVLEHIIPVSSNGGTVLFNCIPTSKEVNGADQKGAKHLIEWWINSNYWNQEAPARLEKLLNYMLEAYDSVFREYTIEEVENSYLEIETDESILEQYDNLALDERTESQLSKQAKNNGIHSYLGFILDCITTLEKNNINTSSIKEKLANLEEQNIFKDIEKYQLYQNIIKQLIISRLGDNNSSYLSYTLNFDIKKLIDSINLDNQEDIYNELDLRLKNIEQLLSSNNLSIVEYFKSLKDIQDIDILYKNNISLEDIKVFLENIKIGIDTKINIFINMLNEGNYEILKPRNKEKLKGYPNISLSQFWNMYQDKIKIILFKKKKDNQIFEPARQTILTYFNVGSYEELITKQEKFKMKRELDLKTKIEIFIDMLNKENYQILKNGNKESLEGYPEISASQFWNKYQDKIKLILFEKEKENSEYEVARQTILTYFNVGSYEELITKQNLNKQIKIFIDKLNEGNYEILKQENEETLKGYPDISLSYFWNRHQDKIKIILFEKEKDNQIFEPARQTILTYFNASSYQELEFKNNLQLRITCFINMLNEANTEILKYENNEIFKGNPNTPVGQFWHREKNRKIIIEILFERRKEDFNYDTARNLILKNLKVKNIKEYYERRDNKIKKLKEVKKVKKSLEEVSMSIDEQTITEQRKRA